MDTTIITGATFATMISAGNYDFAGKTLHGPSFKGVNLQHVNLSSAFIFWPQDITDEQVTELEAQPDGPIIFDA